MNPIRNKFTLLAVCSLFFLSARAQNLDDVMKEVEEKDTEYATATFKGTRLLHGHSIESPAKGVLQVMFSHRFGTLEDPIYTFLGMTQASIRFGFDYGISNKLSVGLGRSSGLGGSLPPPTYDFYGKYRLITQSKGEKNFPVSIALLGAVAINTQHWPNDGIVRTDQDRFTYTTQALIARKFNDKFSLQLMPTFIHRNLTEKVDQKNDLFAIGFGGRYKFTKRLALNIEYYMNQPNTLGTNAQGLAYNDPMSIGFDIETGGHVFQIMFTNGTGLIEPQFIGLTETNFWDGAKGIRLGFNFTRVFTVKDK